MFKDIPSRSSLWGDVKAQLPDLLHWATEFSDYGAVWCEPLPRERKAAHRWETPDYCKYSHLHPPKLSREHIPTAGALAGFGVAELFRADGCGAVCLAPCMRLVPGGCGLTARLRLVWGLWNAGQLCDRCQSVPQFFFHLAGLLLQLWILQGFDLLSSISAGDDTGWECL